MEAATTTEHVADGAGAAACDDDDDDVLLLVLLVLLVLTMHATEMLLMLAVQPCKVMDAPVSAEMQTHTKHKGENTHER